MHQIFVDQDRVADGAVTIEGADVHHMADVLRMTPGERLRVSTTENRNYLCELTELGRERIAARILTEDASTEPDNEIYLFQAIPKGNRMETIIEKAVELGVYAIIPVEMKRCVVRWDDRKKESRVRRYQAIAQSAAAQSRRSRIPIVQDVVSFARAVEMAKACDISLAPYECKEGMAATAEALRRIVPGKSVSILIGPEGGFAPEEIAMAAEGMDIVSLGRRILRTDTAAIAAVSMVMLASEFHTSEG